MFEVRDYLTAQGDDPYALWLMSLADRQARARILIRVGRMASGNFGDVKPVGEGVMKPELFGGRGTGFTTHRPDSA